MLALYLESIGQDEDDPEEGLSLLHLVPDTRHESSTMEPRYKGHKPILSISKM